MDKKIVRRAQAQEDAEFLHSEALHPILKRVYASRGIRSVKELERGLEQLYPYTLLKGINEAVNLLFEAIKVQKRILIVGDFDADGATSTAIAVLSLRQMGARYVDYIVPNRFEYGYGLTPEIIAAASHLQPDVIITVDNGISSCQGVEYAKEKGCQVLITDHHLPSEELPAADAIVNPNQRDDEFPSKNLAGVGVIFYVMLALRGHLRQHRWFEEQNIAMPNMAHLLDIVALGTVADVVALDSNNRILIHQGVMRIRSKQCRPGILALLHVANRRPEKLIASDLGFAVAPRLNAAGRLKTMSLGVECLLCEDFQQALIMAKQLDQLNQERKLIEADMHYQAATALNKLQLTQHEEKLPRSICLFDEGWHQGVIGILAGRIKDKFHRPTVVFALANQDEIKGSARSITGLHIRDVFDKIASKHPGLLIKFGGHAMAAGLTIQRQHYQAFVEAFSQEVENQLSLQDLQHVIHSDGNLESTDLSVTLAEVLREAGPWGQAFPEPVFDGHFNVIEQRIVGGQHLKMTLGLSNSNRLLNAIAFNVDLNRWPNHRCQRIEAAYRLDINEYNGQSNLQLVIECMTDV